MYIHNLFKYLRTTEGIMRERLNLTDEDWKLASEKYAYLKLAHRRKRKKDEVPIQEEEEPDDKSIDASYLGAQINNMMVDHQP